MAPPAPEKRFPSAFEDARSAERFKKSPQTLSPSYKLAYADQDFMLRDELRPVRLQLELWKPELLQEEHQIKATVVVFGSTRIVDTDLAKVRLVEAERESAKHPKDEALARKVSIARRIVAKVHYYDEARRLAQIVSHTCHNQNGCNFFVVTGGGPGIMEAANRGASDVGAKSLGLNIVIPHEQEPNHYITPELSFQFHYFAIRKMHFLMRAVALVAFPGGFGTFDELFETLTLIQTHKIKPIPVLLFGREHWERIISFDGLVDEGMIAPDDLNIFQFVETAEEAWKIISDFYDLHCTCDLDKVAGKRAEK